MELLPTDYLIKTLENQTAHVAENGVMPIGKTQLRNIIEKLRVLQKYEALNAPKKRPYIDKEPVEVMAIYTWKVEDACLTYAFIEHDCKRFAVPAEWLTYKEVSPNS